MRKLNENKIIITAFITFSRGNKSVDLNFVHFQHYPALSIIIQVYPTLSKQQISP
jgi:hypothetical protein